MKKIACFIVSVLMLVLFISCSDNAEKEQDEFDAYGKNEFREFEYINGVPRKTKQYNIRSQCVWGYTEYEYDEKGVLIKSTYCGAFGDVREYSIYEYGDNNILLKKTIYDSNNQVIGHEETQENYPNGNEKVSRLCFNHSDSYSIIEYDQHGNETKNTEYDAEGKMTSYEEYEFDKNGNETKYAIYFHHGNYSDLVLDMVRNYPMITARTTIPIALMRVASSFMPMQRWRARIMM